ncbi:MAG: MarR family transcriptional regulator [Bradyrhizobium sp.]|nr:MarR family transcriptional regulator [Bradyrhizobium sp.]
MRGVERLAAVDRSTPAMAAALPTLPIAETVMVRLMRIGVVGLGQFFEPVFRDIGLTESSLHVLCLLVANERGQASPSELSDLVGTSRANMTRILDALIADKLVLRSSEGRDARRAVIQVTPQGRAIADRAIPRIVEPLRIAFSDLSRDEFAQLETLLRKAIKSFDKGAQPLRATA